MNTIVNAANELINENINWVILGDGRRRKWLEEEIKRLKLDNKVFLLGRKSSENMPYYFALADALLVTLQPHPVMSAWVPGKVQSYLACGKPVIASLEGSGADVISESGGGYIARPGDHIDLANKVLKMIKCSELERNNMGERALRFYKENFDKSRLIDKLEKNMKALVDRT